jgi:hypothetical protein
MGLYNDWCWNNVMCQNGWYMAGVRKNGKCGGSFDVICKPLPGAGV